MSAESFDTKYACFDTFDDEIEAAVNSSKEHQDDISVNKLVEIKNVIESCFSTLTVHLKQIFDQGMANLDEEIVMAKSRFDEKKRVLQLRESTQFKKEDFETPGISLL